MMIYNADNGTQNMEETEMDYIVFGKGHKPLIFIPGLGDSLKSVKGSALMFSFLYRMFAHDYRVYVFSRKNKLKPNCSTRDMAADLAWAMKQLGIEKAHVVGISQGGMIAQYLAADFAERVEKLVLAVTLCRQNETSRSVISHWITLAEQNDFQELFAVWPKRFIRLGGQNPAPVQSDPCADPAAKESEQFYHSGAGLPQP